MFLIRQAKPEDVETLLKLARMVYFINLPADKDVISDKVRWSRRSFQAVRAGEHGLDAERASDIHHLGGAAGKSAQFMFVLEDTDTGNPVGTSSLIGEMGSAGNPNVSLALQRREFFSRDLQVGATHVTAKLVLDESGPSEIGGLILGPSFRGHRERLGKQLSFVRFHYMGLHKDRFKDTVIAEMMAPITADGQNSFWEYFGRRFINLTYDEADRFCAKSREFMTSLLPREEIYLTLMPPEARALVGRVGRETEPAKALLERLGFKDSGRVDPFDAGPILEAKVGQIPLVRDTAPTTLQGACAPEDCTHTGFVSIDDDAGGGFRAAMCGYAEAKGGGGVRVAEEHMEMLGASEGATLGLTPLEKSRPKGRAGAGKGVAR